MSIEVRVPMLPESVADATVSVWHKKAGDAVSRDENLVDLETDKVMLEVPAPAEGILKEIRVKAGATVNASQVLAVIETRGTANTKSDGKAAEKSSATAKPADQSTEKKEKTGQQTEKTETAIPPGPAVRRVAAEHDADLAAVKGTGRGGRITRENVMTSLAAGQTAQTGEGTREEKRVPMSRMRARIAERLLEVSQTTAMLTTFNEINLQQVTELRSRYREQFEKRHGVRLGFMSFFVRAAVEALKRFPAVNASIDGSDIVYHGYYDVGVAVSTDRGLVVPVLRDADQMTMADIEAAIAGSAEKARSGKLAMEDMQGGTFTLTNGGVFGSLLSTPILNAPQSAILGMHKIEQRPVAENGQVVIRPMMYVALSYDHRIIDGRESVSFLVAIKELLEDPARLLLGV